MYHIDEILGIVSAEVADHLDLILAGEDCLDERNDFMWEQSVTDQTLPGGCVGIGMGE